MEKHARRSVLIAGLSVGAAAAGLGALEIRMGHNERTSVDANLQLHGIRNAYAVTGGNFVMSGPANPTLPIVAFAHRLAEHAIASLRAGAYEAAPAQVKT